MPAPQTYSELENVPSNQEDQRTLQIALELSNLGLLGNCDDDSSTSSYDEITKNKRSQNMTECVPVPSSEHVAEIVGRQGCKIKALRAKTNTYIKTPVRGEEPVFVVTGRKEDVAMARREVQSAAEHFTQIRASRNKHSLINGQTVSGANEVDGTAGTITLQVRVPYRVVGLVVGPKGATIKRIQQQTHTYIVTPSRDKEPVFEVTGLPENVEKAKEEIEAHIATRTGTQQQNIEDDFKNNGTEVVALNSAVKEDHCNTTYASYERNVATTSLLRSQAPSFFPATTQSNSFEYTNGMYPPHDNMMISWGSIDPRQTFSLTPRRSSQSSSGFSPALQHPRLSPTLSDSEPHPIFPTSPNTRGRQPRTESYDSGASQVDAVPMTTPFATPALNIESGYSSGELLLLAYRGTTDSLTSGSPDVVHGVPHPFLVEGESPRCVLCKEGSIVAALVPCGHNLFCFSCANRLVSRNGSFCPCCNHPASMALLIKFS
uniref:RNA-binding protein MEX3B n=1 Tax=Ciona intestinalis TaxID=7719 RepID=F7B369_CIOIN